MDTTTTTTTTTTPDHELTFAPGHIGGLRLRNRILRAGCFEGLSQGGRPTPALLAHHRAVAAGGAALTTVAYCGVSADARAYGHELWMREEIVPELAALTAAIHAEGAAASLQLGHCGYFADPKVIGARPIGPSAVFCLYRLSRARPMTEDDIERVAADFAAAARLARAAGFDAVEVHAGHGYLLSQFLSPFTNRRTDRWGGSLEGRLRFPTMVVERVRAALGPDGVILVKMNLFDGFDEGLQADEAVPVARAYAAAGADALVPSCGFTSRTPFHMLRGDLPVREMVRNQAAWTTRMGLRLFGRLMVPRVPYEDLFLFQDALRLVHHVPIPLVLLGGVRALAHVAMARRAGFDFVQLGRPLVMEPDLPRRWQSGDARPSACDACNRCVAAMDGGGVYCVTLREAAATPSPA